MNIKRYLNVLRAAPQSSRVVQASWGDRTGLVLSVKVDYTTGLFIQDLELTQFGCLEPIEKHTRRILRRK